MAEVTGKSVVDAWRKRGLGDDDLAEIIDVILAFVRGQRDAYRDHVDVDQVAKNRVRSLAEKFATGEIVASDFDLPSPPRELEPLEEIDAKRDAGAEIKR